MLVEKQIPLFQTLSLYSCNSTYRYDKYLQFSPKPVTVPGTLLYWSTVSAEYPTQVRSEAFLPCLSPLDSPPACSGPATLPPVT